MEFKTWIEVSVERMETLKALELPDVFTTDPGAGRIRVVEQSVICAATFHQWNTEQPTLAILPTSRPLVSFHPNIYVVPYSDHSSFRELEDFVSALQPATVVPIVGNHIPGSLSALVPSKRRPAVPVPESVQQYMLREAGASTHTHQVQARHVRPLAPRGVIFESPVKASLELCEEASETASMELDMSEEEADTGSSEAGSTCILTDLSLDLVPKTHRRQDGEPENLDGVETDPEGVGMEEAGVKTTGTARKLFQTLKDTAVYHTRHQSQRGNAQNDQLLPACDGTSQRSGPRIDQEDDFVTHDGISQHNGRHRNNRAPRSTDNRPCGSARSLRVLPPEYVEEIENSILNELLFTEEDLNPRGLLQQRLGRPTCP